MVAVKNTMFCL